MSRIMSFDQDGRMTADFDKGECDYMRLNGDELAQLQAENAKLRELVRDMYYVITTLEEANDEAVVRGGVMLDAAHFAKRMREMGIEEV